MSKDFNWLERKCFILGYKNISARALLKTFNGMNGKFLTQQLNRELLNYYPRGEQMTRILKEFTNRGFLTQENTMEGFDGKGTKKARYIYEVVEDTTQSHGSGDEVTK